MSVRSSARDPRNGDAVTISFGEKFAESEQFNRLFAEGMALVEEAAAYLDGPGRKEARQLSPELSFAYATESMRLTTRLMQIASWLLIRRAVKEGEMTPEEAEEEEHKVDLNRLASLSRSENFHALPETLQDLITRSCRFYERIRRLDHMMAPKAEAEVAVSPQPRETNPLDQQLARLRQAFQEG